MPQGIQHFLNQIQRKVNKWILKLENYPVMNELERANETFTFFNIINFILRSKAESNPVFNNKRIFKILETLILRSGCNPNLQLSAEYYKKGGLGHAHFEIKYGELLN